jgi:hypothetical protein
MQKCCNNIFKMLQLFQEMNLFLPTKEVLYCQETCFYIAHQHDFILGLKNTQVCAIKVI